jgi:toxin-antitoxin system PIN domain toxin
VTIPDLNILLYAVDASSSRHAEAKAWLEGVVNKGGEELGIPWVVHLGFVRLTTSPKIFPRPLQIDEACAWMDNLLEHPAVMHINPGKAHPGILRHLLLIAGSGGNLVTDAHLAALALEHDAVLASGDRDFLRFPGLRTRMLF